MLLKVFWLTLGPELFSLDIWALVLCTLVSIWAFDAFLLFLGPSAILAPQGLNRTVCPGTFWSLGLRGQSLMSSGPSGTYDFFEIFGLWAFGAFEPYWGLGSFEAWA